MKGILIIKKKIYLQSFENDIFQIDWVVLIVRQWDFGEEGAWKVLEFFLFEGRNNDMVVMFYFLDFQ